jgi:hypothetical protein
MKPALSKFESELVCWRSSSRKQKQHLDLPVISMCLLRLLCLASSQGTWKYCTQERNHFYSFMNKENTLLACCKRGMYPFNRNPLDDPEVLRSAPDNVWLEQTMVLQCRGITHKAILPSKTNLLELGLGHSAGSVNATESLAQTLHNLNHVNATTANIFKLAELAKNTAVGRMRHNMHGSTVKPKEYQRRYKSAPRLTSNVIFGAGDGILGKYARDNAWKSG